MLKRLVIIGLIWWAPMAYSQVPRDGSKQSHDAEYKQDVPPHVQSTPEQNKTTERTNEANKQSYPWHELYSPANIPSWALFGAASLTLIVISWQAKSALLNTQAMIRTERPWIVITVERIGPGNFRFVATNRGRTPADIISIHGCHQVISPSEEIPTIDYSKLNESLPGTPPCLLPATDSCTVFIWDEVLCKKSGLKSMDTILFYGKVRYYDIFEADTKVLHETTYNYRLIYRPFVATFSIPKPHDPKDNRHT